MTILELPALDRRYGRASLCALPAPGGPALPDVAVCDARLQFQLIRMIGGIFDDPDLDLEIYLSLLGHLAQHRGHPEQAILAHLRDVHAPGDLPPYKGTGTSRKLPKET